MNTNETVVAGYRSLRSNKTLPMFGGALLFALNWIKQGTLWSETPIFDP
jgi:hypothetical protein